ncbi:hypothetical protein [Adhaeribacter soli]|uniref:Uncharacterized protein n=1 Tax=Adhaeribacter soli TaxID=2607655 RepID=A0A5N1J1A0_9BACT|nr:hypothetical protein [Adhaeribacter soli]KAA9340281.1 hypothetical protein F0P94_08010 [Adhaeribacter soli]
MKITLSFYAFSLALLAFFFTGCKTSKPTYSFAPISPSKQVIPLQTGTAAEAKTNKPGGKLQTEESSETLLFHTKKVKPIIALALPQTNTKAIPVSENLFPKKVLQPNALKKIKGIKDGPAKGPLSMISGIFLGIGMALLLAALAMLILGTSGAGTLALIGGSAFLAGSIIAIMALLKY